MTYQTILFEMRGRTALVTINRPDKLNALNAQCKAELAEVFARLKIDAGTDAVVVTGAGEKSFVAGTDIAELAALDAVTGRAFAAGGQAVFDQIQHLGKPVIAAVNGYALGGGCELALACHIRLSSDRAKFGQPEVNLGIIPGYGGTQRLARLVGAGRAAEMILTGNTLDAQEAFAIGLVSRVVPAAELLSAALELAGAILAKGQIAVRMALKAINVSMETSLSEGLTIEASLFGECCSTADFREGTSAFLEKRKPNFTAR